MSTIVLDENAKPVLRRLDKHITFMTSNFKHHVAVLYCKPLLLHRRESGTNHKKKEKKVHSI